MRLMLLIACLWSALASAGELELRVIEPRQIPPAELLPLVNGLLSGDESASVFRNALVVNARPETLERIDTLLQQVDKPLRNLLIHLRRQGEAVTHDDDLGASGSISSGDTRIGTGDAHRDGVRIHGSSTVSTRSDNGSQSIRAIEGKAVLVHDGQLVALPAQSYWGGGIAFADVQRGFIVTARVQGDTVLLDIDARDERLDNGTVRSGGLQSTISGRLGEWIYLGGSDDASTGGERGLSSRYRTRNEGSARYEIMVESID